MTRDQQGRSIVRERDINWLLRAEPIKKLFNEDDLLFFKYVLVEKAGLNLRYKVAHCLIDYSGIIKWLMLENQNVFFVF